jgi:uncharacterized membrane protein YeiH
MNLFTLFDLLGTLAFAISGALAAIGKRFDPFGVFILALVTAVGGGSLRDILIGRQPVIWMTDLSYMLAIILGTLVAFIFHSRMKYLSKSLFLFDAIGLGIFTIVGTEIGLQADFHPMISISLGTLSAAFGGVIRDTLSNEVPVIFRKEIYATASIAGGLAFVLLQSTGLEQSVIYVLTTAVVILIRLVAVRYRLALPLFYLKR